MKKIALLKYGVGIILLILSVLLTLSSFDGQRLSFRTRAGAPAEHPNAVCSTPNFNSCAGVDWYDTSACNVGPGQMCYCGSGGGNCEWDEEDKRYYCPDVRIGGIICKKATFDAYCEANCGKDATNQTSCNNPSECPACTTQPSPTPACTETRAEPYCQTWGQDTQPQYYCKMVTKVTNSCTGERYEAGASCCTGPTQPPAPQNTPIPTIPPGICTGTKVEIYGLGKKGIIRIENQTGSAINVVCKEIQHTCNAASGDPGTNGQCSGNPRVTYQNRTINVPACSPKDISTTCNVSCGSCQADIECTYGGVTRTDGIFITTNKDCTGPTQPPAQPTNTPRPPTATPTRSPTPTRTPTPSRTPTPNPSVTPTPTLTPSPTLTVTPSLTPTPAPAQCSYGPCSTENPCATGLICITAQNGRSYCSMPEYQYACATNPTMPSCCSAPTNTPMPTNTPLPTLTPLPSNTPLPTMTAAPTNTPRPTNTPLPPPPQSGIPMPVLIIAVPAALLLLGLLL